MSSVIQISHLITFLVKSDGFCLSKSHKVCARALISGRVHGLIKDNAPGVKKEPQLLEPPRSANENLF